MVKYAVTKPDELVPLRQRIEAHLPSKLFIRASKTPDRVHTIRVASYAIKFMEAALLL